MWWMEEYQWIGVGHVVDGIPKWIGVGHVWMEEYQWIGGGWNTKVDRCRMWWIGVGIYQSG